MPVRVLQTTVLATTITSARNLPWVPLNIHNAQAPIQWSYNRTGNGAEVSCLVQYTLDDVLNPTSGAEVSALAINIVSLNTAASAATVNFPATAIRLRIGNCSGANSFAFRVLQYGK